MTDTILNIASSHARLALRVYFNVVLLLFSIIGDRCCRGRSQLRLLQRKSLDIVQTTGWLQGSSAMLAMISLRQTPCGWLGGVMISASIFWLASDLVVSGLVVTVILPARCPFDISQPYEVFSNGTKGRGPFTPTSLGSYWDLMSRSQDTSIGNGGLSGIYHKVNGDTNFRAGPEDVLGRWKCSLYGYDKIFPAHENASDVAQALLDKRIFFEASTSCFTQFIGQNEFLQLLVLSPSIDDWSGEKYKGWTADAIISDPTVHSWSMRASVDMSPNVSASKLMRTYDCNMYAPRAEYIMGKVQPLSAMATFCPNIGGKIFGAFADNIPLPRDPAISIAEMLNVITMSAGGSYLDRVSTIHDPTIGCLAPKTAIPAAVILVWALVTFTMIILLVYWAYVAIRIHQYQSRDAKLSKLISSSTPNGLLSWMKQAVCLIASKEGLKSTEHTLGDWVLFPLLDQSHLQLLHRNGYESKYGSSTTIKGPTSSERASTHVQKEAHESEHLLLRRKPVPEMAIVENVPLIVPDGPADGEAEAARLSDNETTTCQTPGGSRPA